MSPPHGEIDNNFQVKNEFFNSKRNFAKMEHKESYEERKKRLEKERKQRYKAKQSDVSYELKEEKNR